MVSLFWKGGVFFLCFFSSFLVFLPPPSGVLNTRGGGGDVFFVVAPSPPCWGVRPLPSALFRFLFHVQLGVGGVGVERRRTTFPSQSFFPKQWVVGGFSFLNFNSCASLLEGAGVVAFKKTQKSSRCAGRVFFGFLVHSFCKVLCVH